jgi:hypothetical protein
MNQIIQKDMKRVATMWLWKNSYKFICTDNNENQLKHRFGGKQIVYVRWTVKLLYSAKKKKVHTSSNKI